MPRHPLPRSLRIEFGAVGIIVVLFALVVKLWLRPNQVGGPGWSLVYGVAPSFCVAFGMSLISAASETYSRREALWFAGFMLLLEVVQPFIPIGRWYFDPYDVVAILVGIGIYLGYRALRTRGLSSAPNVVSTP